MIKLSASKNLFLVITFFATPPLIIQQVDFTSLHGGIPPNEINCAFSFAAPLADPLSPPHDDEETECLSFSHTRDEEIEEKPYKRKSKQNRKSIS